jgi:uncharacterized membrane protein YedE/YeeE
MAAFNPWSALAGGALIGLAAVLLMVLNGRIAGVSGILAGLFRGLEGDKAWRLWFILGLIAPPLIAFVALGRRLPEVVMPGSWLLILAAGLLVGFGARLGGGCTSGHGICGIARLSTRSIVATAVFMAAAVATVWVVRHGFGA